MSALLEKEIPAVIYLNLNLSKKFPQYSVGSLYLSTNFFHVAFRTHYRIKQCLSYLNISQSPLPRLYVVRIKIVKSSSFNTKIDISLYVIIMSRTRFRVNLHSIVAWISRNSLLETGTIYLIRVTATKLEPEIT